MLELDKIHCGDNCDLLGQLPRECIDLVVTSPPIDDEEELEPEPEIDSNGFFCRFTPWQIDKMASHLLGEKPLCEKWISRDGKEAILYPLRLSWTKKTELAELPKNTAKDVVDLWKTKFGKKPPKTSI